MTQHYLFDLKNENKDGARSKLPEDNLVASHGDVREFPNNRLDSCKGRQFGRIVVDGNETGVGGSGQDEFRVEVSRSEIRVEGIAAKVELAVQPSFAQRPVRLDCQLKSEIKFLK